MNKKEKKKNEDFFRTTKWLCCSLSCLALTVCCFVQEWREGGGRRRRRREWVEHVTGYQNSYIFSSPLCVCVFTFISYLKKKKKRKQRGKKVFISCGILSRRSLDRKVGNERESTSSSIPFPLVVGLSATLSIRTNRKDTTKKEREKADSLSCSPKFQRYYYSKKCNLSPRTFGFGVVRHSPPFYFLLCVFVNIIRLACSISDGQHLFLGWVFFKEKEGAHIKRCHIVLMMLNWLPYRMQSNGQTWGRQTTLSIENRLHLC